jgi:hypothetical protein
MTGERRTDPHDVSEIRRKSEKAAPAKGVEIMNGFKRRRKALEKKSERMWDAKGLRACAHDAQTLTPRAGGRVEALRGARHHPRGEGRAAGARDAREKR